MAHCRVDIRPSCPSHQCFPTLRFLLRFLSIILNAYEEAVEPGGPGEKGHVDVQKSRLYQQEIQNFDPTLNPPLPACSTITRITSEVVENAVKHSKIELYQLFLTVRWLSGTRESSGRVSKKLVTRNTSLLSCTLLWVGRPRGSASRILEGLGAPWLVPLYYPQHLRSGSKCSQAP